MENKDPILELFVLRAQREFTPQEIAKLKQWAEQDAEDNEKAWRLQIVDKLIRDGVAHEAWEDFMLEGSADARWVEEQSAATLEKSLALFRAGKAKRRIIQLRRYISAACVLIIISSAVIYQDAIRRAFNRNEPQMNIAQQPVRNTPSDDAVLYYGDSIIPLDSLSNHPMNQPGTVVRFKDKELIYENTGDRAAPVTNKIVTTPGKRYRVTLSDGTRVWLNGHSSLEYPSRFYGSTREVILKGEGFFEVTSNANRPFIVRSGGHRVTVLGTRFNIDGYDSSAISTTLVDGLVMINTQRSNKALKPGYTSLVDLKHPGGIEIMPADTAQVCSWISGRIAFNNVRIDSMMTRLTQIYDFGYSITGDYKRHYSGAFSLNESAEQIVKRLELNNDITFKWNGDGTFVEVVLK
jgi:transmembrane sensor